MGIESYRRKMAISGKTNTEKILNTKKRDIDIWFETALNKHLVQINDVDYDVIIQDIDLDNEKDTSDNKYLLGKLDYNIKPSDIVTWETDKYIILSKERNTVQTHNTFKIMRCNTVAKWIDIDGKVHEIPAYALNQTLYSLGVKEYEMIDMPNAKMILDLPQNEETLKITRDMRFIVDGFIWKIANIDTINKSGIIHLMMGEDIFTPDDNIELGIADYYKYYKEEVVIPPTQLNITGDTTIKLNQSKIYTLTPPPNQNVDWYIIGEYIPPIIKIDNCTVKIGINSDSKNINKTIILRAVIDTQFVDKEITIRNIF